MTDIAARLGLVRQRLIAQSRDAIDMGDYKDQIRAYQEILNETLKLSIELAVLVEGALIPPPLETPLK